MRIGSKYLLIDKEVANQVARKIDSGKGEFSQTMGYSDNAFPDEAAFRMQFCSASWIIELHQALCGLLHQGDKVLGVGSGYGEHEYLLFRKGYDITASDIEEAPLKAINSVCPELKTKVFDVFTDTVDIPYNVVLATGMDCYFKDDQFVQILSNFKKILLGKTNRRVIFCLRYNDNFVTKCIDFVVLPVEAYLKKLYFLLKGQKKTVVKKEHGFRRSRKEIKELAAYSGWDIGVVSYAGFGVELSRSVIFSHIPFLLQLVASVDKKVCLFNNVTIFEFK